MTKTQKLVKSGGFLELFILMGIVLVGIVILGVSSFGNKLNDESPAPSAPPNQTMSPNTTPSSESISATDAARKALAKSANISEESIQVVSVEPKDWSDGSLGCPEAGRSYVQIIIPGYRIKLQTNNETFEYHTNQSGSTVVTCSSQGKIN